MYKPMRGDIVKVWHEDKFRGLPYNEYLGKVKDWMWGIIPFRKIYLVELSETNYFSKWAYTSSLKLVKRG